MDTPFPETRYSWIDDRLDRGHAGVQEILDHIMVVYNQPLAAYAHRSRKLTWDDPDELVNEFLVDGLQRPDYVTRWRESSIQQLRIWLVNGLHFQHRKLVRKQGGPEPEAFLWDEESCLARVEPEPFDHLQRAWRDGLLRLAIEQARLACEHQDRRESWAFFEAHRLGHETWADIGRRSGLSARTVEVRARAGMAAFQRELFRLLEREGIPRSRGAEELLEIAT